VLITHALSVLEHAESLHLPHSIPTIPCIHTSTDSCWVMLLGACLPPETYIQPTPGTRPWAPPRPPLLQVRAQAPVFGFVAVAVAMQERVETTADKVRGRGVECATVDEGQGHSEHPASTGLGQCEDTYRPHVVWQQHPLSPVCPSS
jgi:hypothetical protein